MASHADPSPQIRDLQARLADGSYRRSAGTWFKQNYEAFEQLLTSYGDRTDRWSVIAAWFQDQGIMGARGRPIKPESLRRLWDRVVVARKGRRRRRRGKIQATPQVQTQRGELNVRDDEAPERREGFKFDPTAARLEAEKLLRRRGDG